MYGLWGRKLYADRAASKKNCLKPAIHHQRWWRLRRFYGYATAIFEEKITTGIAQITLPPAKQVVF
jgi:hypothetical protein